MTQRDGDQHIHAIHTDLLTRSRSLLADLMGDRDLAAYYERHFPLTWERWVARHTVESRSGERLYDRAIEESTSYIIDVRGIDPTDPDKVRPVSRSCKMRRLGAIR
jgi:hypothetical protein